MKNKELAHMLELAQDESTPENVLNELWYGTTSVKVRKAVASNPNASTSVLRIASRLYLEEVIENPGFQMIRMFDSDPWIGKVYEAYEDPRAFFIKYGKYHGIGVNGDLYNRAILLSKSLTAEALNCCLAFGSKSALDRAIKNKSVFANIQAISKNAIYDEKIYSALDLESIFILYKCKILQKEDLMHSFGRLGLGSTSAKKRHYSDFFNKTIEEYNNSDSEKDKEYLVSLFSKLVMVSRSHTLHWIDYWQMRSPDKIDFVAKVLKTIINGAGGKRILSDHRRTFTNVIGNYVTNKLSYSERKTKDFEEVYTFFKSYGIESAAFEFTHLMNFRSSSHVEQIKNCSIEAKEFFVKSGALGPWVAVSESDDKYLIINEINERLYAKHGVGKKLLFNCCSLRKIISIDDSTYIY